MRPHYTVALFNASLALCTTKMWSASEPKQQISPPSIHIQFSSLRYKIVDVTNRTSPAPPSSFVSSSVEVPSTLIWYRMKAKTLHSIDRSQGVTATGAVTSYNALWYRISQLSYVLPGHFFCLAACRLFLKQSSSCYLSDQIQWKKEHEMWGSEVMVGKEKRSDGGSKRSRGKA